MRDPEIEWHEWPEHYGESFAVQITDTETGESVWYGAGTWDEGSEFNWSENNYSCDCNRCLFFHRTKGVPEEEIPDHPCGDERYAVTAIRFTPRA